ncbi:alpha/beta fold hydrolase [Candidatus Dependentiae bacterium]|nr:alpha/beta fold hydrolase [Candidatus Dependentiae bacterium]
MRIKKIIFLLSFFCDRHIYSLLPFHVLTHKDASYDAQIKTVKKHMKDFSVSDISFESKENEHSNKTFTRKGFLTIRPNALGTIIFCHGYTHSKHEAFFFKTFFPNFNALAFDFRAHGELIDGQHSTIGADEIYDVLAAVEFVRNHPELKEKPIIGFGFSMGAVSLLRAQAQWQNLFDMLILDSPFDSGYDCMSQGLEKMMKCTIFGREFHIPGKKVLLHSLYSERLSPIIKYCFRIISGFDPYKISTKFVHVAPIETAHKITIPCLFFACVKDNKVPVDAVKRLYETVNSPFKRMWITQGIKHCSAYLTNPEVYWYKMNKFVKKVLDKDMKVKEKMVDDRIVISVG